MKSAFRMLLAAMIRDRCEGSERLDQRIQRHRVEAAENAQQHDVDAHPPTRAARRERRDAGFRAARKTSRREPQVDRE